MKKFVLFGNLMLVAVLLSVTACKPSVSARTETQSPPPPPSMK